MKFIRFFHSRMSQKNIFINPKLKCWVLRKFFKNSSKIHLHCRTFIYLNLYHGKKIQKNFENSIYATSPGIIYGKKSRLGTDFWEYQLMIQGNKIHLKILFGFCSEKTIQRDTQVIPWHIIFFKCVRNRLGLIIMNFVFVKDTRWRFSGSFIQLEQFIKPFQFHKDDIKRQFLKPFFNPSPNKTFQIWVQGHSLIPSGLKNFTVFISIDDNFFNSSNFS